MNIMHDPVYYNNNPCVVVFVVQETQERFPKLGQVDAWDGLGSGEPDEGSTTDCDDEDGCQASGDGAEKTCK